MWDDLCASHGTRAWCRRLGFGRTETTGTHLARQCPVSRPEARIWKCSMKNLAAIAILVCGAVSVSALADEPVSASYRILVPPAPQFVPTKVWDDGVFTYIQLRAPYHGDLPAVFEVLDGGQFAVVDAKWDEAESRFVVRKIIDRVELRLDEKHVDIVRS
jgi:hypothetical protein